MSAIHTPQLWLPDRLRQRREDERLLKQLLPGRGGVSRRWMPGQPCCCDSVTCDNCALPAPRQIQVTITGVVTASGIDCPNCGSYWNDTFVLDRSVTFAICTWRYEGTLDCDGTYGEWPSLISLGYNKNASPPYAVLRFELDDFVMNATYFRYDFDGVSPGTPPPCDFDGDTITDWYANQIAGPCDFTSASIELVAL